MRNTRRMVPHRVLAVVAVALAGWMAVLAACASGDAAETNEPGEPPAASPTASPSSTPSLPTPTPTAIRPTPTPTPVFPETYELPDLHTLPPEDLRIQRSAATGDRELRFTSSVANLGTGPLILIGTYEAPIDRVRAVQRIRTTDGEMVEREVGHFVYYGWHGHWHFEDFNLFELWTYDDDGELVEMLTTSGKNSWCITETDIYRPTPEIRDPYAILGGCDSRMQAIATGWVDTYEWDLHGQQLDLRGIPEGRYAFVSTVNPDGLILERDDSYNTLVTYIEISGWNVTVVDAP